MSRDRKEKALVLRSKQSAGDRAGPHSRPPESVGRCRPRVPRRGSGAKTSAGVPCGVRTPDRPGVSLNFRELGCSAVLSPARVRLVAGTLPGSCALEVGRVSRPPARGASRSGSAAAACTSATAVCVPPPPAKRTRSLRSVHFQDPQRPPFSACSVTRGYLVTTHSLPGRWGHPCSGPSGTRRWPGSCPRACSCTWGGGPPRRRCALQARLRGAEACAEWAVPSLVLAETRCRPAGRGGRLHACRPPHTSADFLCPPWGPCAVSRCLSLCPSRGINAGAHRWTGSELSFTCMFPSTLANCACVLLQGKYCTVLGTRWICLNVVTS